MAAQNNKLRIVYLIDILMRETDEKHGLTIQEIYTRLEAQGFETPTRKTIYADFEALDKYGLDILKEQDGHDVRYHLVTRTFELPELKLLVDAVQSSKFITEKKSHELIKKLESFVSKYDARHLHRQVLITGRIKAMNESIYYNVDMLHEAINADRQIKFQYFQWNINRKQELRRNGDFYQVSPWCLMWDDENYYLVGYDFREQKIKHYRVDKITKMSITDLPREGKQQFKEFDAAKYTKSVFGMFGGDLKKVTIEAKNNMIGPLIDRFGKDIIIVPVDDARVRVTVEVMDSKHFLGWIISLGEGVKVVAPGSVVEEMKDEIRRLTMQYLWSENQKGV